jgi:hypothetical protein
MSDDLIPGGPVDRFLDELFDKLAGTGADGRRSVAEAEDHLRSAVAESVAAGADPERAEREAVERFGRPGAIATQLRVAHRGVGALIRPIITGTVWVGLVGLVSEVLGRAFGAGFVAGDTNGVTYTAARCADFFEYVPNAGSCEAAASQHHWGEVVQYRVALGVLGLLALAGWALLRRRTPLGGVAWRAPAPVVALVVAALAGASGAALLFLSVGSIAFGDSRGAGANLADGGVALLVAVGALIWAVRRGRRPVPGQTVSRPAEVATG